MKISPLFINISKCLENFENITENLLISDISEKILETFAKLGKFWKSLEISKFYKNFEMF